MSSSDGTILATTAYAGDSPPFFPIFSSSDRGASWKWLSNLTDQVNGLGMAAQPALAELSFDLLGFPKGTVLASGNSWGSNSTNIDLYASRDKGKTWEFASNVARGSHPDTTNGNPLIDDVAYLNYTDRPGMAVITYVGRWILVHEFLGGDNWSGAGYPLYYHLSDGPGPFTFRYSFGYPIVVNGVQPSSSPYVVWSPVGGVNGTIGVSDADHQSVFTNRANGHPDRWEIHDTPQPNAYCECNPDHLALFGASSYPGVDPPGTNRPLFLSVVSLTETLKLPAHEGE
ncbi:hypothetical protein B0H10DRAFT_2217967 [Mycena sp. CBHHK59/15]|nr:hypothetical protein B0H10DRAFT_2217967 [Mycena sp. CBHHK59/15]